MIQGRWPGDVRTPCGRWTAVQIIERAFCRGSSEARAVIQRLEAWLSTESHEQLVVLDARVGVVGVLPGVQEGRVRGHLGGKRLVDQLPDAIAVVPGGLAEQVVERLEGYWRAGPARGPAKGGGRRWSAAPRSRREWTGETGAAGKACARVFEKIAREGRKFGLGLVLASQRPSEVSPTVLSQCNTFLLHRLVNDRDQELVKRLVADGLGPLLRELPSLPTRRAILLGWAAPAPILVEVEEIGAEFRPHSPDPAFWHVWTGSGTARHQLEDRSNLART